jgi:hypothetical protein
MTLVPPVYGVQKIQAYYETKHYIVVSLSHKGECVSCDRMLAACTVFRIRVR